MGKKGGKRRYFSKEYKLSIVKRNIDGEGSGKLSKESGVDKSLICHWARAYRDKGENGLETKRHPGNSLLTYQKRKGLSTEDQLRYELAKKDIELAKLKKLLEYQRGECRQRQMKRLYYDAILKLSSHYAVIWLCQEFGVSRSGYYKWIRRKGKPNYLEIQKREIISMIREIHCEKPSFGYRRIRNRILTDTGWYICLPRVLACMQVAGIQSKARKKKHWGGVGKPHPIFPNILSRQFYSQIPLQKVVTDITEFYWHGRKCFFTCYLDLFNNEMLSWNLGFREDLPFILKPLKEFLRIRRKSSVQKTIIHTDQGSQYCSPAFTTLLKRNGIIQSMSRAGTPHDNAVIESFFGWFKEELNLDFHFKQSNDIFLVIKQAVTYFNSQRPVSKLDYKPLSSSVWTEAHKNCFFCLLPIDQITKPVEPPRALAEKNTLLK